MSHDARENFWNADEQRPLIRCPYHEENIMDKDRIKGSAEQAKGKAKEVAGKLTGDEKTKNEGKLDQAEGKAQNAWGSAKDTARGDD